MSFDIPGVLAHKLHQHLTHMIRDVPGLTGALVVSVDGFVMTQVNVQGPEKIAAMASSVMGLSGAMSKALNSGQSQHVWMEFDRHKLLFMSLDELEPPVYVAAIGQQSSLMGTMLWRMKQCCQDILLSIEKTQ